LVGAPTRCETPVNILRRIRSVLLDGHGGGTALSAFFAAVW
jgi:hypothetical protein